MSQHDKKKVNDGSKVYWKYEKFRRLPRSMRRGTQAMRDMGEKFLPQYEAEDDELWEARRDESFLENFVEDTVEDLLERSLKDGLNTGDLSERMQEHWEDIDLCGTHGDRFVADLFEDALWEGSAGVVVDFPENPDRAVDKRPYWIPVQASDVIEVLTEIVEGKKVISRVRLLETKTTIDGWDVIEEQRVRVMYRANEEFPYATWEVWRPKSAKGDSDWEIEDSGEFNVSNSKRLTEIPFVPFTIGVAEDLFYSYPPLQQQLELNLQHWQKKSKKDHALTLAGFPALVITGMDKKDFAKMKWGTANALVIEKEGGDVRWVEISGQSIPTVIQDLLALEERIREAGKQPRVEKASGDERATIRLLDEARSVTRAQAWLMGMIQSINKAIEIHAEWMQAGDLGEVEATEAAMRDLGPSSTETIIKLATANKISTSGAQEELKRRGVLPEDWDVEEDVNRIATERSQEFSGGLI